MKIVRENLLYLHLNENMQQARSILKKAKISESDPIFQNLKQMLLDDNAIGYIGKFTKWLIQDRESWDKLTEVYEMVKNHPTKVPPIDTFKTLEDLFDFLQGSTISTKSDKAVRAIEKRLIYFKLNGENLEQLSKLLELNVKYVTSLTDFYNKKGRRFKNFKDLYKSSEDFIKNLTGGFNLEAIKKKIKDLKAKVEISIERPDLLVFIPEDFHASQVLGSTSWCIQWSRSYWDSYADIFSNQYFIFDFTKSLGDKRSMIGATINPDESIKACHYKDDTVCSKDYLISLFSD